MNELNKLYQEVFDKDGNIKACGREKCKKLIDACNVFYQTKYNKELDFGNSNTGFMNVENIKKLIETENN